ncbi:MAG: cell division protein ZapE, partial [Hyphomicrobiales bacterium]|nr:cell division protein ZapE [Hyphomicrobiales bacterium]
MSTGPIAEYRARLSAGDLRADPHQALAVEKLQSLHNALSNYEPDSGLAGWKARFGLSRRRTDPPQGLYLYGGVGRGKSMVMDMFFRSADVQRKRRVHFHAFMRQVHGRLNEYRKWKGRGDGDPIPPVAKRLADEAWLLCFDELQVLDIADAMILGRLFQVLFEEGVVVVCTSNRPPHDLYKDGLQRALFLPFIDLFEDKLDVLALDGPIDHRLEQMRTMDVYRTPLTKANDQALGEDFRRLGGGAEPAPALIPVNGREVKIPLAADGVGLATFADLCEAPLGPSDFLEIAARFHTLVLAGIPRLDPRRRDAAKRFVTLIDALYEAKVNLVCSADAPPEELYPAGDGAFEFARTASR